MGSASDEPEPPGCEPPYPGLSAFDEAQAGLFFGRAAERDLVVANLLTSRLTVLYGPSGAGKSSLLRAGVVPRLQAGEGLPAGGSRRTVVVVDAWQGDPVRAILTAVAAAGDGAGGADPRPLRNDLPLDEALAHYGRRLGRIVLLMLDQFEEYFLYHADDRDRLRSELPLALSSPDVGTRVLISLREDALAALDSFEASTPPLFGNLVRLDPMPDAAAAEAITKPAELAGITLEPGLPERVLRLLRERPTGAGAPAGVEPAYLQLVMRRLWELERRDGSSVLRIATLESMGSLGEVIGEHLGRAMDRLTPAERRTMADALQFMVTPSGAKIAQRRADLAQLTGTDERDIARPLKRLSAGDARILRPVDDAPSYEIFHDVLANPLLDWQARFRAARLQRRAAAFGMLAVAAAAIVLGLVAYIFDPGWLRKAELRTVDTRFSIRGTTPAAAGIVIVDLDDASLAALGGGGPRIPRPLHARMIDTLREAGSAVIAYDFEFPEQTPADASLREAIDRAGGQLLLAATQIDSDGQGKVLGGPGDDVSANVGYAGFPIAPDGAYRQVDESVGLSGAERVESGTRRLQSFAVVAAYLGGDPSEPFERAWIDYRGPARTYPTYSFADVLRGLDLSRFEDKIVVVGTSARKQGDLHPTRHGGGGSMSGAEIQASAIATVRDGRPLRDLPTGADLALVVLLGLVPALLLIAARPARAAALLAVVVIGYLLASHALFATGWILPIANPLLALVVSAACVFVLLGVIARRRRERVLT